MWDIFSRTHELSAPQIASIGAEKRRAAYQKLKLGPEARDLLQSPECLSVPNNSYLAPETELVDEPINETEQVFDGNIDTDEDEDFISILNTKRNSEMNTTQNESDSSVDETDSEADTDSTYID